MYMIQINFRLFLLDLYIPPPSISGEDLLGSASVQVISMRRKNSGEISMSDVMSELDFLDAPPSLSQQAIVQGRMPGGEISSERNIETMQVANLALSRLTAHTFETLDQVSTIVGKFLKITQEANEKIQAILSPIISNFPSTSQPHFVQATAIMEFIKNGLMSTKMTQDAALAMIKEGGAIYQQKTLSLIDTVFAVRSKEISLFAQTLDVLLKQDEQNLKNMLAIHEVNLKQQAQLFNQLKEAAQLEAQERQASHDQAIATQQAQQQLTFGIGHLQIAGAKVRNEREVQLSRQQIFQQLETMRMQIDRDLKQLELVSEAKTKQMAIEGEAETRRIEAELEAETRQYEAEQAARATKFVAKKQAETRELGAQLEAESKRLEAETRQLEAELDAGAKQKAAAEETRARTKEARYQRDADMLRSGFDSVFHSPLVQPQNYSGCVLQ